MITATLASGRIIKVRGSAIRNMVELNNNRSGVRTSIYLTRDLIYEVQENIRDLEQAMINDRRDIDPRDITYMAAQILAANMPSHVDDYPKAVKHCVTLAERLYEEVINDE